MKNVSRITRILEQEQTAVFFSNYRNQNVSSATKIGIPKKSNNKNKRVKKKTEKTRNPCDKWFRMRNEMREGNAKRKSLLQMIADFVQKI